MKPMQKSSPIISVIRGDFGIANARETHAAPPENRRAANVGGICALPRTSHSDVLGQTATPRCCDYLCFIPPEVRAILGRMRNLIAIATVVMMSLATPGRAATLEEILAKNLTARGGEARLHDIKTLRATGHLVFGGGDFSVEAAWGTLGDLMVEPDLRRLADPEAPLGLHP